MKQFVTLLLTGFICHCGLAQNKVMPILDEKPVRGLYKSFEEFKYNVPSIRDSFYLSSTARSAKVWKGTLSHKPYYQATDERAFRVWGFSDGENCYIYRSNEFFKISVDSSLLGFYAFESAAMEGALIGGGLSAAGAGRGGYVLGAALAEEMSKSTRVYYFLNPYTGKFSVKQDAKLMEDSTVATSTTLIIYREKKKESKLPTTITVDGEEVIFVRNTVVEYNLPISREPIEICSGSALSECFVLYPVSPKTRYYQCSHDGANTEVIEVSSSLGRYKIKKAGKAQAKRERKAK